MSPLITLFSPCRERLEKVPDIKSNVKDIILVCTCLTYVHVPDNSMHPTVVTWSCNSFMFQRLCTCSTVTSKCTRPPLILMILWFACVYTCIYICYRWLLYVSAHPHFFWLMNFKQAPMGTYSGQFSTYT